MKNILFILIALLLATAPATAQIPLAEGAVKGVRSIGKAVGKLPKPTVGPVLPRGILGIRPAISSPVTVPKLGVANTGKPVDSFSSVMERRLNNNDSFKAQTFFSSSSELLEQLENYKNLETPEGTLLFIPHPQISPNPIDNFIDDFKIIQESTCPYLLDAEDENLFFVYIICQIYNYEQAA